MSPADETALKSYGADIRACGVRVTEGCLEIGRLLIAARALIGDARDGRWIEFLTTDCGGMSYMQARRFMRVAERYGDRVLTTVVKTPFRVLAELAAPENDPAMVADLEARMAEGERLTVASVVDAREHWRGLPSYGQRDLSPFRTIHVHFQNEEEVTKFFELMDRPQTGHSFLWFTPQAPIAQANTIWIDDDTARELETELAA